MSGTVDAEYYAKLSNDNSKPLTNYATQAQNAPGSTFKICSAVAGLDQGVITTSTEFFCDGTFSETSPPARCWQRWGHGNETVSTAIRDSCNIYFYNVEGLEFLLSYKYLHLNQKLQNQILIYCYFYLLNLEKYILF